MCIKQECNALRKRDFFAQKHCRRQTRKHAYKGRHGFLCTHSPRIFVFASDFHDTKRYLSHVLNGILTPLQHCAFAFYKIHTFLHRRDKNTSQTYFFASRANYQINKYESCKTKSIFNFQLSINTLRFICA